MAKAPLTTWLRATARGEVPAETIEAYRRASLPVVELVEAVDAARRLADSPWTLTPGQRTWTACVWNAFVLQRLGAAFLEADYLADPGTVGFVPRITERQVLAFFMPIEAWLGHARRAGSDPNAEIDDDLPAILPQWSEAIPPPPAHLHGLFDALEEIRDGAETAMRFLGANAPAAPERAREYHAIRGLHSLADTKARYAEDLCDGDPRKGGRSREMEATMIVTIQDAIELYHRVGQFAAAPELATEEAVAASLVGAEEAARPTFATPGGRDFDPWCLSDPRARRQLTRDPIARLAIERLWLYDPDPAATLNLREEIEAAFRRGDLMEAKDRRGEPIDPFHRCPWGTVYKVLRPVTIGGVPVKVGKRLVIDVSAEGPRGGGFERGVRVGKLNRRDAIDYGT